MNAQVNKSLIFFTLIIDIVLAAVGFILGGKITGESSLILSGAFLKCLLIFIFFLVFFFGMYDLYKSKTDEVFNTAVSTSFAVLLAGICTFFISFALNWVSHSLLLWFIVLIVIWIILVCWRTGLAVWIKTYGPKKKYIIIENMHNTSRLARKLKYSLGAGRKADYFMIDEENAEEMDILIHKIIKKYDLVFISPAISSDHAHEIVDQVFLLGKRVGVLADLDSVSTFRGSIYQMDDTPIIEKRSMQMNRAQRLVKRGFDILFSLVFGILCLPIFLLCAICIKLDSDGPIIYKQERYTKHKKIFHVYKFRTMIDNAEKEGAMLATEDDPRITRVGKVLRATRLDELPQLFNILSGSMSVVGPRPERPVFADEFSKMVKNYDMRFSVKAGLTGYAQIYGKYNTRVSDKILMDIIYILNYSFLLDIKIIFLTGKTMFVKSATEGVEEEHDKELTSEENEAKRRAQTVRMIWEEGRK